MYLIVDLEATCWEVPCVPDLNEIIDIGIIVCDNEFNEIDTWSSFVRPKFNTKLSSFCRKLTSITQNNVDSASYFPEVMASFNEWFIDRFKTKPNEVIWFTWGNWDLKCLIGDCLRNGIDFPFASHRNLKDIYFISKNCDKKEKLGLRDVIVNENIPFPHKLHRGITDALAAAKIAKLIYPFSLDPVVLPNSSEEKHGS